MIRFSLKRDKLRAKGCAVVGVWRSLVAHLVRDEGVAGSNPATPTIFRESELSRLLMLTGIRYAICRIVASR
jgi:hypothetical protein